MIRLLSSMLCLAAISVLAGLPAARAADSDQVDGVSSSGKIGWHIVPSKDGAQVMISEGDQGESAAQKLCEVPGVANTKVRVSPDDYWIIVESGGGSLGIGLTIFQREKGMIYKEKSDMDVTTPVVQGAFKAAGNEAAADKLDHIYTHLLSWSADSGSILVEVSGHGGKTTLSPYLAVYDLGKKSVSLDLSKFNAKAAKP